MELSDSHITISGEPLELHNRFKVMCYSGNANEEPKMVFECNEANDLTGQVKNYLANNSQIAEAFEGNPLLSPNNWATAALLLTFIFGSITYVYLPKN